MLVAKTAVVGNQDEESRWILENVYICKGRQKDGNQIPTSKEIRPHPTTSHAFEDEPIRVLF